MDRFERDALPQSLFNRLRAWFGKSNDDTDFSMLDMRLITAPNAGPTVMLPERLGMLGLDPYYLRTVDPVTYGNLEAVCGQCPKWRQCARDLAQGDATSGLQRYCYNSAAIDDLIIARHKG
jgi:hypothetical protein